MEENKALKINFDNAQREIKQLREVENSLFKTLKTAEDTGANMIDQANRAAELHLRETQMSADALLNEAKSKARITIEEADDKATRIIEKMESELKAVAQVYRNLENQRDNLMSELENLSKDTVRRVEKMAAQSNSFDLEKFLIDIKEQNKMSSSGSVQSSTSQRSENKSGRVKKEPVTVKDTTPVKNNEEESSFFDNLG